MDSSPSGSSVRGVSQARILEWVATSFSMGSSWPRDWTWVSCIGRQRILYCWAAWEAQYFLYYVENPAPFSPFTFVFKYSQWRVVINRGNNHISFVLLIVPAVSFPKKPNTARIADLYIFPSWKKSLQMSYSYFSSEMRLLEAKGNISKVKQDSGLLATALSIELAWPHLWSCSVFWPFCPKYGLAWPLS